MPRTSSGEGLPDVEVGGAAVPVRRRSDRHIRVIAIGGDVIDGVSPGVGEQCLQSILEAMPVLRLKGVIACRERSSSASAFR